MSDFNLTLYFPMSYNGQTQLKILQHLLQDFKSVLDHFATLLKVKTFFFEKLHSVERQQTSNNNLCFLEGSMQDSFKRL